MGIHAPAVQTLIDKARFSSDVALGVAEAIDASIMNSQFVTVPVLDARLQELRADIRVFKGEITSDIRAFKDEIKSDIRAFKGEITSDIRELEAKIDVKLERLKAELVRWVLLVMVGNVAISLSASAISNYLRSL